jgi:SAM-dependent methyltransferase
MNDYVHGYSQRDATRLTDQAQTLAELLHGDTCFTPGSRVLEAGCGTGAQTEFLAKAHPDAQITAIDIAEDSLCAARERIAVLGLKNVSFQRADLHQARFTNGSFDHIYVCFVLEHLTDPQKALIALRRLLRPGGTITVIEGDHGSAYYYPPNADAQRAIQCQIDLQATAGGDALIGRRLYPLLSEAGFSAVQVSPRMVYVDGSRPEGIDGFTLKTFTAMIEGVGERAVEA